MLTTRKTTLKVKRAVGLSLFLVDKAEIDSYRLLRGDLPLKATPTLKVASPLTEETYEIELRDFEVISAIPETTWSSLASLTKRWDITKDRVIGFAEKGLLVSDASDPKLVDLRERDDLLRQVHWSQYSRLSHFMTKWSDDYLLKARKSWSERNMPASFEQFEQRFGPAPPPLLEHPGALATVDLPLIRKRQSLFRLLKKRRTTRSYDRRRKMSLSDFSTIMYYCFGCHGYKKMSKTLTLLKKTSPSGGALHPIEVYPLITKVEGLDAGTYHYDVSRHSLDLLEKHSTAKARDHALCAAANQEGYAGAHAVFMLVARFERYFWKYQNHPKAYKVLSMDAAHLSQTLYLVCTELGLGAFFTGAVNDKYIENLIGLDGVNNGVIAICGCGVPKSKDPKQFSHLPFVPRQTNLSD